MARELSRQAGDLEWEVLSVRQTNGLLERADRVLLALYHARLDNAFGRPYGYDDGKCMECGRTDGLHYRDCEAVS